MEIVFFFMVLFLSMQTRIFCVSMMKYKYMLAAFSWKLSSGGKESESVLILVDNKKVLSIYMQIQKRCLLLWEAI